MSDDKLRERARARAMNALNTRAMSRGEMRERLIKLGESEDLAEETADWLAEIGVIDDAEYAGALARNLARRGYGARRMRDEFFKRKIPRELWDDAIAENADEDGSAAAIIAFIEKRLRGDAPSYDEKRRVSAALARRGFSWDEINEGWRQITENR